MFNVEVLADIVRRLELIVLIAIEVIAIAAIPLSWHSVTNDG